MWARRIHTIAGLLVTVPLLLLGITGWILLHPRTATPKSRTAANALLALPGGNLLKGTDEGLFRSSDGGMTWKEVEMLYPLEEAVALAASSDGRRIWAAGRWSGLFLSEDGGRVWRKADLPFDPYEDGIALTGLTAADGRLFLATSAGMLASADGGNLWEEVDFRKDRKPGLLLARSLHNGLFFGGWMVRVYDLTLFAALLLIGTGLYLAFRKMPVKLSAIFGIGLALSGPAEPAEVGRAYYLMGTVVRIHCRAPDEETAKAGLRAGFETIRRLDDLLSIYKKESEISLLNAGLNSAAGRKDPDGWVPVSPETWQALRMAVELAEKTGGAFDPTIRPLMLAWGLEDLSGRWPSDKEVRSILPAVNYRRISLRRLESGGALPEYAARLQPPTQVDLGGIGKGYAADLAVKAMREQGAAAGWVDLGGQFLFFGPAPDPKGWEVQISYPEPRDEGGGAQTGYIRSIHVPPGSSVATSSLAERSVEVRGFQKTRIGHILDPRTGYPAGWQAHPLSGMSPPREGWLESATVVASSAAFGGWPGTLADALSTAVFVLGLRDGLKKVSEFEGAEALIVLPGVEGLQVRTTPGWKKFTGEE